MNSRILVTFTIALLGIGGFAFAGGKTAKLIPSTSITFDAGGSLLTEADKNSLRNFVRDAEAKGTIDQITVAAWSDKALPRVGQKLPDSDRKLADLRAGAIGKFLTQEMEVSDVDTYNMAETANWLARTFNTKDAELKSVFGRTGAEMPVTRDEFQVIKREGGPSMAVAVVEYKSVRMTPEMAPTPDTPVTP